ncbi:MAG: CopG family transcriptional regulator [Oscillospiraceae bacterium]|nr:CopG family transcriptional regulator [Oscillospiraceae bacterium]
MREMEFQAKGPLVIKRRGEDGNRVISVRIREDTLAEADRIAAAANISRNEQINRLLEYGLENVRIEK